MEASEKGFIKSAIYDMWGNLGKIIIISLLWGGILFACIFFLPTIISLAVLYFIGLPILTGNVYAISKLLKHEKYTYLDNFRGTKLFYTKSLMYYGVIFIASFILGASFWQYNKMKSQFYLILLIIQGFFYICFLISQIYTISLMIEKNMDFKDAFMNSLKMTAYDPGFAIKSWLKLLVSMLLSFAGFITVPLFSAGIFGVFSLNIFKKKFNASNQGELYGCK